MHWAVHGSTAAEVIAKRADSNKPMMGLTSYSGDKPQKADAVIAKNYLSEDELDSLNRIVTLYLEFAELQAKKRKAMYMKNWINKLDDFLRLSEHDILTHAGKISHDEAVAKAQDEFDKFKTRHLEDRSAAELHFEESIKYLETAENKAKKMKFTKKNADQ